MLKNLLIYYLKVEIQNYQCNLALKSGHIGTKTYNNEENHDNISDKASLSAWCM